MLPRQFGDYMLLYVANIPSVLRGLNLSDTKKIGLDLSLAVFFINIVGMRILFHSFFYLQQVQTVILTRVCVIGVLRKHGFLTNDLLIVLRSEVR